VERSELIAFTKEVSEHFDAGTIPGPIHLCSDTQIEPLLEIFKEIKPTDWVLSTWRSMYHALLKGVPRELVMKEVLEGRSMQLHFPEYRFMSSSIMGGMLPIACGLAAGKEKVWCFVGDMCASTGAFQDARKYASCQDLNVEFVVEDNGLSTNTPTERAWGPKPPSWPERIYRYERTTPHYGTGNGSGF
jgi:TPP-dependent pyruvate/acetoin dehydrogenase alpha subunit